MAVPVRAGLPGVGGSEKEERTGVPTAAAMCMGPVSPVMRSSHRSRTAPVVFSEVFPMRLMRFRSSPPMPFPQAGEDVPFVLASHENHPFPFSWISRVDHFPKLSAPHWRNDLAAPPERRRGPLRRRSGSVDKPLGFPAGRRTNRQAHPPVIVRGQSGYPAGPVNEVPPVFPAISLDHASTSSRED